MVYFVFIAATSDWQSVKDKKIFLKPLAYYASANLLILTIMLSVSFACVIKKLRQKFSSLHTFENEIKFLSIVYIIFCLTYLFRFIRDVSVAVFDLSP